MLAMISALEDIDVVWHPLFPEATMLVVAHDCLWLHIVT
jgi:hypothetical protein